MVLMQIPSVLFSMLRFSQCDQIFRAVIGAVSVDMVDHFTRVQQSAICLFPNKPMLKNITSGISSRMIRSFNVNIPPMMGAASFPAAILFSTWARLVPWYKRASTRTYIASFPRWMPRCNFLSTAASTQGSRLDSFRISLASLDAMFCHRLDRFSPVVTFNVTRVRVLMPSFLRDWLITSANTYSHAGIIPGVGIGGNR